MCGIWTNETCTIGDSCNVFGHDFDSDGDCRFCFEHTERAHI